MKGPDLRFLSLMLVAMVVQRPVGAAELQEGIDCSRGGSTQLEMNVCAGREADAASAKLSALVKELERKLDAPARDELQKIQAQWQELRSRDCNWERSMFAGGSLAPLVHAVCATARTNERIQRLKILLCEGAGMTGPCEASRKY